MCVGITLILGTICLILSSLFQVGNSELKAAANVTIHAN